MHLPATQADVLAISRQVDGLFAAAFHVTHELGVAELAYVADAFDPEHGGAIAQASRVICEACRRSAATGRPYHQTLERAAYPTLVVAAVPFAEGGVVRATVGVIFFCVDEAECLRGVATIRSAAER